MTRPPSLDVESVDEHEHLLVASVHYRIATGPHTGRKALTLRTVASNPLMHTPCQVRRFRSIRFLEREGNPRRAEVIKRLAKRMYPKLRLEGATQWMGRRPSMPDGLPVIGPSPRHENLWLAFGHGHTGMVAGPMTGRIIAGMITGAMPNIDVAPFRADRF